MNSTDVMTITWLAARASGWVAYVLLTASVVMGLALSRRWFHARCSRMWVHDAHVWVTVLFYVFLAIHLVTDLLDPFTKFTLADMLVPFVSDYRSLWLSLGIVAGELAFAVGLTFFLRRWMNYDVWHGLHMFTYAVFLLSLLHGLGTGSDTATTWGAAIYGSSAILVLFLTLWRLSEERAWRLPALAMMSVCTLAITLWAVNGPLGPQWAVAAGTPQTLLTAARQNSLHPTITPTPVTVPNNLRLNVSGQVQVGSNGRSQAYLMKGSGTGTEPVDVAIEVTQSGRGLTGQIELRSTATHTPLCSGPMMSSSDAAITFNCSGYGQSTQLAMTFAQLDENGFSGTLTAVTSQQ